MSQWFFFFFCKSVKGYVNIFLRFEKYMKSIFVSKKIIRFIILHFNTNNGKLDIKTIQVHMGKKNMFDS